MNIVLAASEAFPFCKTGGLADVVGALCQQFSARRITRIRAHREPSAAALREYGDVFHP